MSSLSKPPACCRRIVLTGFMGSGKTTVGRLLAVQLDWAFVDLDERIEAREGRTVPQIFAEQGEKAFRAAETAALCELLDRTDLVLALGGGAIVSAASRGLLEAARETAIVHLDAPFAVLYDRCASQALDPGATARPVLGDRSSAEARYAQRGDLYASLAHHRADAIDSPAQVATAIRRWLFSEIEAERPGDQFS